jgi:hypothetical protein
LIKADQGEVAVLLQVDKEGEVKIDSYCLPDKKKKFTKDGLRNAYLLASLNASAHDKEAHYSLSSYLSDIYSVKAKIPEPNLSASTVEVVHAQNLKLAKLFDVKRTKNPIGIPE